MKFVICFLAMTALGCAQGYCYGRGDNSRTNQTVKASTGRRVFVYKQDGSKQCNSAPGVTPEDMADELKDMQVYSKVKKSDGKMHITLCGSPTDKINVFEIDEKDLAKAKAAKFEELR
jgi:choice-of-anchor A domain-containing protein